jgi:hypothetical protein
MGVSYQVKGRMSISSRELQPPTSVAHLDNGEKSCGTTELFEKIGKFGQ